MQRWSWGNYVMQLGLKGYDVRERRDSKGILHGYTLRESNVIIKASELRGRAFMVSRLEETWRKLHVQKAEVAVKSKVERTSTATNTDDSRTTTQQPQPTPLQPNRAASPTSQSLAQSSVPRVAARVTQSPAPTPKPNYAILIDYTQYRPDTIPYILEYDGKEHRYYIPEKVLGFFDDEFDHRETANWQELKNFAVALFIGIAGGLATAPSGGSGGSSTDNNWVRDKDEDDLRWARRCAKAATQKLGKQPKYGLRR